MGARAQVLIKDEGVYLYTHWGAEELGDDVIKAIKSEAGKGRWDDPEYLARIIFDCMKGDDITGETGFGIGTKEHSDIECLVTVDCAKRAIKIDRSMYGDDDIQTFKFEEL
jgi:hypothetical protein